MFLYVGIVCYNSSKVTMSSLILSEALHEGMGWTECMMLLFKCIHKDNFSPDQIFAHMQNIHILEQRLRTLEE